MMNQNPSQPLSVSHRTHRQACKEWAVVCEAIAQGKQNILLRKGGIHEGPDGFQLEHPEFWLFPTGFHQSAEGVREEFQNLVVDVAGKAPAADRLPIQHYVAVDQIIFLSEESQLAQLEPFHVFTHEAVLKRFHYRQPGIYVLSVQSWSLPEAIDLTMESQYDGCRSWVTLSQEVPTQELVRNSAAAPPETEIRQLLTHLSRS